MSLLRIRLIVKIEKGILNYKKIFFGIIKNITLKRGKINNSLANLFEGKIIIIYMDILKLL